MTEPLKLSVGKEYNLNNIKVIEFTKDFLTLDQTITDCQNIVQSDDCKTNQFIDALLEHCGCLPFSIKQEDQVKSYLHDELRSRIECVHIIIF